MLEVETILKEELKVKEFQISFDDYEATSFDEVPDGTKKVKTYLKIEANQPYISISFYKYSTSIFISSSNLEIEGAMSKIKNLLKNRTRTFRSYFSKVINWGTCLIPVFLAILVFWLDKLPKTIKITFLVVFFFPLFFGYYLS